HHFTRSTLFPYTTLFRSYLVKHTKLLNPDGELRTRNKFLVIEVQSTLSYSVNRDNGNELESMSNHLGIGTNGDVVLIILIGRITDRKSTRLNSSHVKISY